MNAANGLSAASYDTASSTAATSAKPSRNKRRLKPTIRSIAKKIRTPQPRPDQCLTPNCHGPNFKRGLCSRCDSERRKYQKAHPEITDQVLVDAKVLAPKTSPPGRQPNTTERDPLWLPFAAVALAKRRGRKSPLATESSTD